MRCVTLRSVALRFAEQRVFEGIDLTFKSGTITALMGPSGSGKSSLLKLIAGMIAPSAGRIEADFPVTEQVAMLFQTPYCFPWMTVQQNLAAVTPGADGDLRSRSVLESIGLEDVSHRHPWTLSGGMLRRLCLAMTLQTGRDVILLDEPFAGLDDWTRDQMIGLLGRWAEANRHRALVVLSTHSFYEAARLAHRVIFVDREAGLVIPADIPPNGRSFSDAQAIADTMEALRTQWPRQQDVELLQ